MINIKVTKKNLKKVTKRKKMTKILIQPSPKRKK